MKFKILIIGIFTMVFLSLPSFTTTAQAAQELTQIDAVLVLDVSGSMNFADPGRLSYEAMKMFIDMLPASGSRVGIVSYNDQITESHELILIENYETKQDLISVIDGLVVGGFTDITVGLMEALRLLEIGHAPPNRPVIILFTDGNNHLSPGNPRTEADLYNDTEQIIADAQGRGIPIYTIGLNFDGTLNHAYIQRFANETGALSFETYNARDLLPILSNIFYSQMDARTILAGGGIMIDNVQEISLEIPEGTVEVNIALFSDLPIRMELVDPLGRPIPFDGHWSVFTQSNHYSLLKAIAPNPSGDWTLVLYSDQDTPGADFMVRAMLLSPNWAVAEEVEEVEVIEEEIVVGVLEEEAVEVVVEVVEVVEEEVMEEESAVAGEPLTATLLRLLPFIAGGAVIIALAIILIITRKKRARVFTGRLVIEITDNYSGERHPPQYRNLIEYGRKTDLLSLLRGQGSQALGGVILFPSPTAPSHMPQLIVKCQTNPGLKFKKDFLEHDASKGLSMNMRTEISIQIEAENKNIVLRYME